MYNSLLLDLPDWILECVLLNDYSFRTKRNDIPELPPVMSQFCLSQANIDGVLPPILTPSTVGFCLPIPSKKFCISEHQLNIF